MAKQRFTAAQVTAALVKCHGLVYLTAKRLKCTPDTILNYCKRYPAVEAVKQAQRGELIDLAEEKLRSSIENGEAWGITLCLKTLGKERGYVERQEVTGNDGAPLTLRVVYEEEIEVLPSPHLLMDEETLRISEESLG